MHNYNNNLCLNVNSHAITPLHTTSSLDAVITIVNGMTNRVTTIPVVVVVVVATQITLAVGEGQIMTAG